jgi:hypothetical protein
MSEWIVQHDAALETLSDAGACTRIRSTLRLARWPVDARKPRSNMREMFVVSAAIGRVSSGVSPAIHSTTDVFGRSFRATFERRFASTTVPREAHLQAHSAHHSCRRMSVCTYVVRQCAYTVPAENRSCCVIPRGKRFEHHTVQRSELEHREARLEATHRRAHRCGGAPI